MPVRRSERALSEIGAAVACPATVVAVAFALAAATLTLPSAPGYDPWSWLVWGRELLSLDLSTAEGPAFKPLPVAVTAALVAVSESAAPDAWLVIARAGAILAVVAAFSLARRVGGGSVAAGLAAALGVLLLPDWLENAAVGAAEGLTTLACLLALRAGLDRRWRVAFAWLSLAALMRVEVWPILAAVGTLLLSRDAGARPWVVAAAVVVPGAWFGPEWLSSGELLRSASRARVPNPGAPALADRPALATLELAWRGLTAVALVGLAALGIGLASAAHARTRLAGGSIAAAAGLAWIALVAGMSELGFSGEGRYLLPGLALLTVAGCGGLFAALAAPAAPGAPGAPARTGRRRRTTLALAAGVGVGVALALALAGAARWPSIHDDLARVAYGAALSDDLPRAIERAGGPRKLRACGPRHVGPYRGPMTAWALRVPKHRIGFSPVRSGVALRSQLGPQSPLAPSRPRGSNVLLASTAYWEIVAACGRRDP